MSFEHRTPRPWPRQHAGASAQRGSARGSTRLRSQVKKSFFFCQEAGKVIFALREKKATPFCGRAKNGSLPLLFPSSAVTFGPLLRVIDQCRSACVTRRPPKHRNHSRRASARRSGKSLLRGSCAGPVLGGRVNTPTTVMEAFGAGPRTPNPCAHRRFHRSATGGSVRRAIAGDEDAVERLPLPRSGGGHASSFADRDGPFVLSHSSAPTLGAEVARSRASGDRTHVRSSCPVARRRITIRILPRY